MKFILPILSVFTTVWNRSEKVEEVSITPEQSPLLDMQPFGSYGAAISSVPEENSDTEETQQDINWDRGMGEWSFDLKDLGKGSSGNKTQLSPMETLNLKDVDKWAVFSPIHMWFVFNYVIRSNTNNSPSSRGFHVDVNTALQVGSLWYVISYLTSPIGSLTTHRL